MTNPQDTDMEIADLEALLSCVDIHTHIAKTILNKEEVTRQERYGIKCFTFGLMFGNGVVISEEVYALYQKHFPNILRRGEARGLKPNIGDKNISYL